VVLELRTQLVASQQAAAALQAQMARTETALKCEQREREKERVAALPLTEALEQQARKARSLAGQMEYLSVCHFGCRTPVWCSLKTHTIRHILVFLYSNVVAYEQKRTVCVQDKSSRTNLQGRITGV